MTFQMPANSTLAQNQATPVDIEAWTERTVDAFTGLTLSGSPQLIRSTMVELAIPLDAPTPVRKTVGHNDVEEETGGVSLTNVYPPLRRKTSQRDSLKRREALLKGNEGSRRRQKWENGKTLFFALRHIVGISPIIVKTCGKLITESCLPDRLIGNPYAQPPLPYDWEVRPTHLVKSVPYYLASMWDAKRAEEDRQTNARHNNACKRKAIKSVQSETLGRVPKQLKDTLKRSRAAKTLLQELEGQIRTFVETWNEANLENIVPNGSPTAEIEDNEFVVVEDDDYVLRSGMIANPEKLVFGSPEGDHTANFNRYLVHALGAYYGLETWSVTRGDPPRREAYVGVREKGLKPPSSNEGALILQLPRPMWARV